MSPSTSDHRRVVIVAISMFLLFSLLIIQFYKIQVIEETRWTALAHRQQTTLITETHHRGIFYSNVSIKKGMTEQEVPLVINVTHFHLYADPHLIPPPYRTAISSKIMEILDLSPKEDAYLMQQLCKKSRSRKLAAWIPNDRYEVLKTWWSLYAKTNKISRNALFFIQDSKRCYPFGKLLGQVLHTVRGEREARSYVCTPTGGLELSLDQYLKGKDGKRKVIRSPRQVLNTGEWIDPPRHGANVYLTINHHLQAIAEEEIAKAVHEANGKGGWAIMMDPHNGHILAWAEYPFFEPAHYPKYFNDPSHQEATKIKAVIDPFEPGSIMKPLTLAVCPQANLELSERGETPLFDTQEKIDTRVGLFPGRKKAMKDLHLYPYLNMRMALQKSSNVYMAKLIQRLIERMGINWYRTTLHNLFDLGKKTGIELPAETHGKLPSPGKKHPNGKPEWDKATPYSLAIGHNLLVNSLQMLKSYSILVNGGFKVTPTLVQKIVAEDGTVLLDNTSLKPVTKSLNEGISRQVREAMRFVTQPGGTAQRAAIPGYTEGGKTATAEKIIDGTYSKHVHISTFIGFAPATNPRFVLLVTIDEPESKYIPGVGRNQYGGICAAPTFSSIALKSLRFLGIPQDDPLDIAWNQEVKTLKEVYDQWNSRKK